MEELYGWIRNLTGYFLFMSVLDNLMPGKKYTKYIRLFAGMVMILLVIQPLTGSLRLEDRIAHYYESFVFHYQADDLKQDLLGVEKQRLWQMIEQYEHAVEQDVRQMAEDMNFAVAACQVKIDGEEGTERFGTVTEIHISLLTDGGEERQQQEQINKDASSEALPEPITPVEQIAPVDQVVIGQTKDTAAVWEADPKQQKEHVAIGKLRRKIASYYNLEEIYVEIQVLDGER